MGKSARAIVIENGNVLVMFRNKSGRKYHTLVGGQLNEGESLEDALVREVMEETGLEVTAARLVFTEMHPAPYNEQYIFLCEVAPHAHIAIQEHSEESKLNRLDMNIHQPEWVPLHAFDRLNFVSPALQRAILHGIKAGFPATPEQL